MSKAISISLFLWMIRKGYFRTAITMGIHQIILGYYNRIPIIIQNPY